MPTLSVDTTEGSPIEVSGVTLLDRDVRALPLWRGEGKVGNNVRLAKQEIRKRRVRILPIQFTPTTRDIHPAIQHLRNFGSFSMWKARKIHSNYLLEET